MIQGCLSFRLDRREFFRLGGAGLFGLTMPNLVRTHAAASASKPASRANQMIAIWLDGGPPHLDMFDMKPEAPAEIRGEFKPIQTNTPGLEICELMPQLAKIADKYSILRSCSIGNDKFDHQANMYWLTGNPRLPAIAPKYPMYFNVLAKLRPATAALPSFIALERVFHNGNRDITNYLGPAYDPLTFDPANPRDQVRDMLGSAQLDLSALDRDETLLKALDRQLRQQDAHDPIIAGLDEFQQKAFDLLRSPKLRDALDPQRLPSKDLERYGKGRDGTKMLVARRLLEAGAPYLHVPFGDDWDRHTGNFKACRVLQPALDRALAALLEDLDERGLLKTTIVVVMGEMGRTPKINNRDGGRDHWGACQSILVAGGGFKGGTIVGASDKIGAYVTDKHYKVESFGRTIYTQLGIDPDQEVYTTTNRPMKIILADAPLIQQLI